MAVRATDWGQTMKALILLLLLTATAQAAESKHELCTQQYRTWRYNADGSRVEYISIGKPWIDHEPGDYFWFSSCRQVDAPRINMFRLDARDGLYHEVIWWREVWTWEPIRGQQF